MTEDIFYDNFSVKQVIATRKRSLETLDNHKSATYRMSIRNT